MLAPETITTWGVGVDHGGRPLDRQVPRICSKGTLTHIVPLIFLSYRYTKQRSVHGLQNTPKSVFGWGSARGSSWRSPRPLGWRGDTPPHTLPHSVPTHLRCSPCVSPEFQPDLRLCRRLITEPFLLRLWLITVRLPMLLLYCTGKSPWPLTFNRWTFRGQTDR